MEVIYEPYEKIIIRSHMRFENPEAFTRFLVQGVTMGFSVTLYWANGVLFRYFPFTPTDSMSKEYINKHLIWDHIDFAPMPEYNRQIRVADLPAMINVLDVSNHTLFHEVTRWIVNNLLR